MKQTPYRRSKSNSTDDQHHARSLQKPYCTVRFVRATESLWSPKKRGQAVELNVLSQPPPKKTCTTTRLKENDGTKIHTAYQNPKLIRPCEFPLRHRIKYYWPSSDYTLRTRK